MEQPGRQYAAGSIYRYGFNGKEKDNEVSGQGNQYDYGFRIYNPRLGKFLSVDPLTKDYPWYTPYQFAGNNPIGSIDIDGLEPDVTWNANETKEIKDNGKIKENINQVNCGKDEACKEDVKGIIADYNTAKNAVADGRAKGLTTAANNLQFYLNGTGGTKLESYTFLNSFSSFRQADKRLNEYLESDALTLSLQVKAGETKTFPLPRYSASLTGGLLFEKDLYYSSGTSFITATSTATITKGNDNKPVITITVAKTWIDSYDWHKGLGVRKGLYGTINDEAMENLQNFGARSFEMRSYFTSTLSFTGKFEKHYIEHGMS